MRFLCVLFLSCFLAGCSSLGKKDHELVERIAREEVRTRELSDKVAYQQELTIKAILMEDEVLEKIEHDLKEMKAETERAKIHARH